MKNPISKLLAALLLTGMFATSASAGVYQFTPSTPDIFDLDHYKYYTWGINWSLAPNEKIVGAQLKIKNINNWVVESNDRLYIHLLDYAKLDLKTYTDNQGGGDNFATWLNQIHLDTYTDLYDSPGPSENYIYDLSADELAKLRDYSANDGRFGLAFDPDCHYWNDGVKFKIYTAPVPEPATMLMMGAGLLGGIGLRRKKTAA